MIVQVKLFAAAKELAGRGLFEIDLPDGSRVADLRDALIQQIPHLEPIARHLLFAIDAEYANDQTPIAAGSDVACIPPVSGG